MMVWQQYVTRQSAAKLLSEFHMEKVQRLVHCTYTSSDVEIGDNFKPSLSNEHLSELKLLFYLRSLYDIRYIKY